MIFTTYIRNKSLLKAFGVSEFKCDLKQCLTPSGPLQGIAKLIQGGALKRAWRWRSGGIIFLFLTA